MCVNGLADRFITARKRSLRRLCFYRCLSVHRGGGVLHPGGGFSIGGGSPSRGGSPSGGGVLHPGGGSPSGQCAGGTHPTGMHSCFTEFFTGSENCSLMRWRLPNLT